MLQLLLIFTFLLIVVYLTNKRIYSKYEKAKNDEQNILDLIPNICLSTTKKFITSQVESYCYYNFIITPEFIMMERNSNTFFLKEIPIIINKLSGDKKSNDLQNRYNIIDTSKNEKNGLILKLKSVRFSSYFLEISINKENLQLENWFIK